MKFKLKLPFFFCWFRLRSNSQPQFDKGVKNDSRFFSCSQLLSIMTFFSLTSLVGGKMKMCFMFFHFSRIFFLRFFMLKIQRFFAVRSRLGWRNTRRRSTRGEIYVTWSCDGSVAIDFSFKWVKSREKNPLTFFLQWKTSENITSK